MAIRDFRLIPQKGFHPLLLGMSGEQVERVMGATPKVAQSRSLPLEEDWFFPDSFARASMRDGRLVEASVTPPAKIWFQGQSLFDADNLWRELVATDGDAHETLGFLVLRQFGLALTGLHDGDAAQVAATVFEAGRWDQFSQKWKPFAL